MGYSYNEIKKKLEEGTSQDDLLKDFCEMTEKAKADIEREKVAKDSYEDAKEDLVAALIRFSTTIVPNLFSGKDGEKDKKEFKEHIEEYIDDLTNEIQKKEKRRKYVEEHFDTDDLFDDLFRFWL